MYRNLLKLSLFFIALFKLYAIGVIALALTVSETLAHSGIEVQILKGQSVELNLRNLCASELEQCKSKMLTVTTQPSEGVIFSKKNTDVVRYQHAGTSTVDDSFVFTASSKTELESVLVSLVVSEQTPTLKILSPVKGTPVKAGDIEVVFTVEGGGVDHVHLSLIDGQEHSASPSIGRYTIEDVRPGDYTLTATLASSTHRNIVNTEVSMQVLVED